MESEKETVLQESCKSSSKSLTESNEDIKIGDNSNVLEKDTDHEAQVASKR